MIDKKLITLLFGIASLAMASPDAWAQGKGKDKNKNDKVYQERYKTKERKHNDDEAVGKHRKGQKQNKDGKHGKHQEQNKTVRQEKTGGILGRVILPPAGSASPRQLKGVPRGHYPPPGQCRVWYPNRPPGHQPPPRDCQSLAGIRLEPGAFILHGDNAYDAEYDWREAERQRPGSVGRDILDILFPRR